MGNKLVNSAMKWSFRLAAPNTPPARQEGPGGVGAGLYGSRHAPCPRGECVRRCIAPLCCACQHAPLPPLLDSRCKKVRILYGKGNHFFFSVPSSFHTKFRHTVSAGSRARERCYHVPWFVFLGRPQPGVSPSPSPHARSTLETIRLLDCT